MATLVSDVGWLARLADRAGAGRRGRPRQRHGRGHLPRPPADHDDQHEPDRLGRGERLREGEHHRRHARAARDHVARRPVPLRLPAEQPAALRSAGRADPARACGAPAMDGCSTPSATTRPPSRLAGVRVGTVLVVLYLISGILAGVAGLVYAGVIGSATGRLVDAYLLPSVAAAVIGGTSIFGGRGGYAGTIVGRCHPHRADDPPDRPAGRRRRSARSCSAPSSWPSRPHTRGSPRSPDPQIPRCADPSSRALRWGANSPGRIGAEQTLSRCRPT